MMKSKILPFAPTPHSHGMRGALSAAWIATGNPRRPLACVWIDRALRSFAASVQPAGTCAITDATTEDAVPLLHPLCA